MGPIEKGKAALLSGIETDLRSEEQQIINEAQRKVAEKRKYAEKKIESILNNARKEAQGNVDIVMKKALSAVALEIKRRAMRVQGDVVHQIMNRAEEKLRSMIGETDYRAALIGLIVEAAIGLGAESAQINASEKERRFIDGHLISQVQDEILSATGRQVTLILSDSSPLKSQGVVVNAADGRTAYDNKIRTRMSRNQRRIRMLIYNALFTDNRKE